MTLVTDDPATLDTDKSASSGSNRLGSVAARATRYAAGVVTDGVRHIEGNMVPVGICAAITFPTYWFVWKFLFPQPYENLWVRLVGTLLCVGLAAKDRWPGWCRRYLPAYWLGTILYSGPFFFTFMLLQNSISTIWLMSTMAGLFLLVLLLDWISLIVVFIAGSLLAWGAHLAASPGVVTVTLYLEFVPIFLFALIAGTIFNYKAAGLRQAKERARLELGSLLAKEMQSPLTSLRTSTASLGKLLPVLVAAYPENPRKNGSETLPAQQLSALERVPARIEEAAEQFTGILEMLMLEGGQVDAGRQRASSVQRCLDDAIARLPLAAELDRARIIIDRQHDFLFHGSPVLMAHVLARVFEASLNEIYNETGAELVITLGQSGAWNYLRLIDSSADLHKASSRLRFGLSRGDRQFSHRPDLALADLMMERIGGSVTHMLAAGRTFETVLWFPQPGA